MMELRVLDEALGAVVATVRRSLVQVGHEGGPARVGWARQDGPGSGREAPRSGSGAGTIWHPDGLIVTNAHVLQGRSPSSLTITLPGPLGTLADGRTLPARLLAMDRELDLAALAVDAQDLSVIELGESTKLRPGELLLALGHPWGVEGAVTAGVVIGVGVNGQPGGLMEGGEWQGLRSAGREWLAASLRVRPGHSGGPMVDVHGRLVGINTIMAGPGVGVAVPVHVVKRFLQRELGRTPSPAGVVM